LRSSWLIRCASRACARSCDLDVFAFGSDLAPNVEHLEVSFDTDPGADEGLDTVSLSQLRSLWISGDPSYPLALSLVNLLSLKFLHIRIEEPSSGVVDLADYLSERLLLPPGLDAHFCHKRLLEVENDNVLSAACEGQGARLTFWTHGLLSSSRSKAGPRQVPVARVHGVEDDGDGEEGNEEDDEELIASAHRARLPNAVLTTKRWALERACEPWKVEDVEVLVRMAETLRQVGERRVLESL